MCIFVTLVDFGPLLGNAPWGLKRAQVWRGLGCRGHGVCELHFGIGRRILGWISLRVVHLHDLARRGDGEFQCGTVFFSFHGSRKGKVQRDHKNQIRNAFSTTATSSWHLLHFFCVQHLTIDLLVTLFSSRFHHRCQPLSLVFSVFFQ